MKQHNNVNDNVQEVKVNNNVNDNDRYNKSKHADFIADRLLEKLHGPEKSRPFMCKVAYKLSEARIWDNLEQALKGKNPMGLFIYLSKKDGV